MTVSEWGERWLEVYKGTASAELRAHFKAKLELDIIPVIGYMPIKNVRASHLQELLNTNPGKKGTITKIRIAIKQLFEAAEIEGIIERNPARRLTLPEGLEETQRRPLTEFECGIVWEVAQTHTAGAYILTMLLCGLRRGECAGLKMDSVNFETQRLSICQAIRYTTNKGRVKSPKSKAGVREIPIPLPLLPILKDHCSEKDPSGYVFTKKNGDRATEVTCKWWWNSFKRQCHIKAGAKLERNKVLVETSPFDDIISPHYIRHTYATDLYAAGVDEKAQKHFLGHASKDVTDIYRKMNEEAFNRAATLENAFFIQKYKGTCQKRANTENGTLE